MNKVYYEKDYKKLQSFNEKEIEDLLQEVEKRSKEGRGLFSKGPLLLDYAIDRESLRSLQNLKHDLAAFALADKISNDLIERGDFENSDIDRIKHRRIVSGFIYLEVPGFNTPIVKFYFGMKEMGDRVSEEDIQKIVSYIKKERKLLPIAADFKVL